MVTTRPRIAYPPYTVLGELRTSELLVISCLRLWVHTYCGCTCGYPDWREGVEQAGIGSVGATGFDTLWRIVASAARRALDIRPIYCAHLGDDEGRFLSLLALLQHGQVLHAKSVLTDWCPASAARLAITPAHAFALALTSCRLWLPAIPPEEATPASRLWMASATDAPRLH